MPEIIGNFLWEGLDKHGNIIKVYAINGDWVYYLKEVLYNGNIQVFQDYDSKASSKVRDWENFPKNLSSLVNKDEIETAKVAKKMLLFYLIEHCLGLNRLREIAVLKKLLKKLS